MKNYFKSLSIFVITFSLLSQAFSFGVYSDVSIDILNGQIEITPVVPEVHDTYVSTHKGKCLGLCSDFFWELFNSNTEKLEQEGLANTYFFLSGNPDDLSFYLISMACSDANLLQVNYISHTIKVLKGEYRVHGVLLANREVISEVLPAVVPSIVKMFPGYTDYVSNITPRNQVYQAYKPSDYVNYACSSEFRKKYYKHSLRSLSNSFGQTFSTKFDGEVINVNWDTEAWIDVFEQDVRKTLDHANQILLNVDLPIGQ